MQPTDHIRVRPLVPGPGQRGGGSEVDKGSGGCELAEAYELLAGPGGGVGLHRQHLYSVMIHENMSIDISTLRARYGDNDTITASW